MKKFSLLLFIVLAFLVPVKVKASNPNIPALDTNATDVYYFGYSATPFYGLQQPNDTTWELVSCNTIDSIRTASRYDNQPDHIADNYVLSQGNNFTDTFALCIK